jgi:hypothetical protein
MTVSKLAEKLNQMLPEYADIYENRRIKVKKLWRLWAKALGQKDGLSNFEADMIAIIRTIIVLVAIITNLIIVSGVVRHWNN